MKKRIMIPKNITIKNMEQLFKLCSKNIYQYKQITFDFTNCENLNPTAIVYITMLVRKLKCKNIKTLYKKSINNNFNIFAKGFEFLNPSNITEKSIYDKYMIKLKKCKNFENCGESIKTVLKAIEEKFDFSIKTRASILYMLSEITDNAAIHGYKCYDYDVGDEYPHPVYIAGFSFTDRIEIAIGDIGQGICNSIKFNNEKYSKSSNKNVIDYALRNTVSGHPNKSPGFGLYYSSKAIQNLNTKKDFANFNVWSNGYYLTLNHSSKKIVTKSLFNEGTLISFQISKKFELLYEELLKDEDEEAAKEYYDRWMMEDIFI